MERLRLATVWMAGCSGCHMSFLDLDEFLIDLAEMADIVYTPLIDVKEYPQNVDVALVEGAVANQENFTMLRKIRERTKFLIAFGDCAVTGNVTAMRNPLGKAEPALERSYLDYAEPPREIPESPGIVPVLLPKVMPLHQVVHIDFFLTGCPPSAHEIRTVVEQVLAGQTIKRTGRQIKFG